MRKQDTRPDLGLSLATAKTKLSSDKGFEKVGAASPTNPDNQAILCSNSETMSIKSDPVIF